MKLFTATAAFVAALPLMALANEPVEVQEYNYGMDLDIAQVLSVKTAEAGLTASCGLQEEEMAYKDSQGQEHVVKYQVVSSECNRG